MDTPRRKNIRLQNWDYSTDACYHVTLCTKDRRALFGSVERSDNLECPYVVAHSTLGAICDKTIRDQAHKNQLVCIENHVVMPNHVHILVWIKRDDKNPIALSSFVHYLKACITKAARNEGIESSFWQKGYYERIVRDDEDFFSVWEYIDANPAKWHEDPYHC